MLPHIIHNYNESVTIVDMFAGSYIYLHKLGPKEIKISKSVKTTSRLPLSELFHVAMGRMLSPISGWVQIEGLLFKSSHPSIFFKKAIRLQPLLQVT